MALLLDGVGGKVAGVVHRQGGAAVGREHVGLGRDKTALRVVLVTQPSMPPSSRTRHRDVTNEMTSSSEVLASALFELHARTGVFSSWRSAFGTCAVPERYVVLSVSSGVRSIWPGAHARATMPATTRNTPSPTRTRATILRMLLLPCIRTGAVREWASPPQPDPRRHIGPGSEPPEQDRPRAAEPGRAQVVTVGLARGHLHLGRAQTALGAHR